MGDSGCYHLLLENLLGNNLESRARSLEVKDSRAMGFTGDQYFNPEDASTEKIPDSCELCGELLGCSQIFRVQ